MRRSVLVNCARSLTQLCITTCHCGHRHHRSVDDRENILVHGKEETTEDRRIEYNEDDDEDDDVDDGDEDDVSRLEVGNIKLT